MNRKIFVSVSALLGLVAGYFAAPFASFAYMTVTDRAAYGQFGLFLLVNFTECNCTQQSPAERVADFSKYVAMERKAWDRNPQSEMLPQLIGLTEVRISLLEQQLGDKASSDEAMDKARAQLTELGWKDVSPAHLAAVVAQIDAQCRESKQSPAKTSEFATQPKGD